MTDRIVLALTLVAALGSGLVAGVFFALSNFVIKALARLPPEQGIETMQAINAATITPLYMAALFGTGALAFALAIAALVLGEQSGGVWLMAGGVLYLLGVVLVTVLFTAPQDRALAAADPAGTEGAGLWACYLGGWRAWNHVRTVLALAATASFIIALVQP